jgi:hypothetical protein
MIEREEFRYIELPVYEYENWIPTRVKERPDPRVVAVRYSKDDLIVGIGIFDIIPSSYTYKLYTFLQPCGKERSQEAGLRVVS